MAQRKGRILVVELNDLTNYIMEISEVDMTKYIGGRGLGVKLLYDLLPKNTDPLSEDNIMLFLIGPLTGTIVPGAGKFVVVTKSPVSNGFLDSYASGRFAVELRMAGYDGLMLKGRAKTLSKIVITDDNVSIEDANYLKGKDTFETEEMLQKEFGEDEIGTVCIGPAGENLVKYASINSDYYRQAARGGIGAVMGSKNIKAISVKGTKSILCADAIGMVDIVLEHKKQLERSPVAANRIRFGTPSTLDVTNASGMLPTKNYKYGSYEEAVDVLDSTGVEKLMVQSRGCYGCMIACSKITEVKEGEYAGSIVEGPEYETLGLFGSNLDNSYLPAIIEANIICDKLGLDSISAGNSIGFLMEAYEKNLVPPEYEDERIEFGNYHQALDMLYKIAKREGIGDILAEGVREAAKVFGHNSEHFAMHVKGLEFPAYDPRIGKGSALSYAISPRGACHRRAWPPSIEVLGKIDPDTIEGKAELVKKMVDENAVLHSLLVCDFPAKWIPLPIREFIGYLKCATGYEYSEQELWDCADRIETLIRLFNNREGLTRDDDTLPGRVLNESLTDGNIRTREVSTEDLNMLLDNYYSVRGWDEMGIPTEESLSRLSLA